jgi:hypothetical protein
MFCYVWGRAEATVRKYFNVRPYHVIVIAHNFIHSLLLNVEASVPILRSFNLTESKFKTRSLHQNNTDVVPVNLFANIHVLCYHCYVINIRPYWVSLKLQNKPQVLSSYSVLCVL